MATKGRQDLLTAFISFILLMLVLSVLFGFARGAVQPPVTGAERAEIDAWRPVFEPLKYIVIAIFAFFLTVAGLALKWLFGSLLGGNRGDGRK